MTPARKDALLDMVDKLLGELHATEIPNRDAPGIAAKGMPRSCLGQVVAFLEAQRSLEHLATFVERLHHLDTMAAQNQRNPRAPYRALQAVLKTWLAHHQALEPDEWLYLLAWTQSQLPRESKQESNGSKGKKGSGAPRPKSKRSGDEPSIGEKKEIDEEPLRANPFSILSKLKKEPGNGS